MKKLLIAMVLLPLMALADAEKVGDVTWSYKVLSEKVAVKGANPCAGKLEIPQTLGGYPVSSISTAAFSDCEDLVELVIPEGVSDIGVAAFCDCTGLTAVTIPSTLTSIGDAAFEGCESLTTIYVSAGDAEGVKAMIADSDSSIDMNSLTFVEILADGGPYTEEVNGIEWRFTISEGKATVGEMGENNIRAVPFGTIGAIEIPSTLGGCPVTSIGDWAFAWIDLTSVVIPSSVMNIGHHAFDGCFVLTSVVLPSSMTCIGEEAFFDCRGLTSVEIPPSVTCIGDRAFFRCTRLASVVLPSSVTCIGGWAFASCTGLMSVTIPSSVTSIGMCAFDGCIGLTSVVLPSSVTSIGGGAFRNCSRLTSVALPSSVTSIGEGAFGGCSGLTSILVDDRNPSYCSQDGVLYDDAKTALLAYPGGKSGAFDIPSSVTSIGEGAFDGCSGLTSILVDDRNPSYCSQDGVLYDDAKTVLLTYPGGKSGSFGIPSSVTSIGENAFRDCSGLASVVIPSSVTSIGYGVFYGCSGLTSVIIPSSVTSVGDLAFCDCSGLVSVVIPSSVTSVGGYAFSGCGGLEKIYVSAGDVERVKEMLVASYPGPDVDSLTFVEPLPDGGPYTETVDGVEWTFCVEGGKAMVGSEDSWSGTVSKETVGALVIPSILGGCPVTSIGDDAFYECSGLTSVTIPEGVTSIGGFAFAGSGLTSVVIPSSVTSIGVSAFCNCSGLMSVTIPSNVASIGNYAFGGCSGLTSVIISRGVKDVDAAAFGDCRLISSVTLPANYKVEDVFPDSKNVITEVTILGDGSALSDYACQGCRLLESVTFDGPISEIGESAFENCRHLESITIPATVKKIDAYAFYGCGRLKTVNYLGEKPEIEGAAFVGTGVEQSPSADVVNVVVSNVVVQYVFNSVQPEFAIPATSDTGFVNIITEVKGGAVAVPATWAEEYPNFVSKYGSDFTKALTMKSGKKDGAGNEMLVWQDYVAGTDPTDENDVFRASITIVDGKVTISYAPELDDARKAMRKYTTWGKTSLMDTDWTEVQDGHEAEYNFFKVSVEMR